MFWLALRVVLMVGMYVLTLRDTLFEKFSKWFDILKGIFITKKKDHNLKYFKGNEVVGYIFF